MKLSTISLALFSAAFTNVHGATSDELKSTYLQSDVYPPEDEGYGSRTSTDEDNYGEKSEYLESPVTASDAIEEYHVSSDANHYGKTYEVAPLPVKCRKCKVKKLGMVLTFLLGGGLGAALTILICQFQPRILSTLRDMMGKEEEPIVKTQSDIEQMATLLEMDKSTAVDVKEIMAKTENLKEEVKNKERQRQEYESQVAKLTEAYEEHKREIQAEKEKAKVTEQEQAKRKDRMEKVIKEKQFSINKLKEEMKKSEKKVETMERDLNEANKELGEYAEIATKNLAPLYDLAKSIETEVTKSSDYITSFQLKPIPKASKTNMFEIKTKLGTCRVGRSAVSELVTTVAPTVGKTLKTQKQIDKEIKRVGRLKGKQLADYNAAIHKTYQEKPDGVNKLFSMELQMRQNSQQRVAPESEKLKKLGEELDIIRLTEDLQSQYPTENEDYYLGKISKRVSA